MTAVTLTDNLQCLTSDYICSPNDVLAYCSDEEKANNVTIRVFGFVKDCVIYMNGSIKAFSNVSCCNTSLCNVPVPSLCSVMKCYNGSYDAMSGCVDPALLNSADVLGNNGNNMSCISYSVDCSVDNVTCTQQEMMNNDTKLVFTYGNQSLCNNLNSSYNNVSCCGTDYCNAPNLCGFVDCYVGVTNYESLCVDDSKIQSYMYETSAYVCASYTYTCTAINNDCTQNDITNSVEKVVFAAVSSSNCSSYQSNSLYKNVICCNNASYCNGASVSCFGKSCYGGVSIADNITQCADTIGLFHMPQNETFRCISYKYKCLVNDSACTEYEINAGTLKWRFSVSTADFCLNLIYNPNAQNITCCNSDLCNTPSTGFCDVKNLQSCFKGVFSSGQGNCAAVNGSLSSQNASSSDTQCISYLDTTNKWIFTSGNDYNCSQLRGPLGARYLTCCGTSNCNYPWYGYCNPATTDSSSSTSSTMTSNTTMSTSTSTTSSTKTTSSTPVPQGSNDVTTTYISIILLLITYLF